MYRFARLLLVALAILALLAEGAFAASTIVIVFKDGTKVSAELPQDVSQISSVSFETSGAAAASGATDAAFKEVILADAMDKGLGANWDALACVGGDFGRFARFENGELIVNVPANNSWTKTGIMSKKPLFTVDNTMESAPMKIALDFDPARTTGYVISLAAGEVNDVWTVQNYWLHFGVAADTGKGFIYCANTQNSNDPAEPGSDNDLPAAAPKRVVLSVGPGVVTAELPSGKKFVLKPSWLKAGTPVYLHLFSHPENQGGPASFALDAIEVGR